METKGELEILDSIWFAQMGLVYLGLVRVRLPFGKKRQKIYLGAVSGKDRDEDALNVANTGARIPVIELIDFLCKSLDSGEIERVQKLLSNSPKIE